MVEKLNTGFFIGQETYTVVLKSTDQLISTKLILIFCNTGQGKLRLMGLS